MLDFYDYGFGNFNFGFGSDGLTSFGANASSQASTDFFGNENFACGLEQYRQETSNTDISSKEFVVFLNEALQSSDEPIPIEDVFAVQAMRDIVRNNPSFVVNLNGALDFILNYQIDVAASLGPLDDAQALVNEATNNSLIQDSYDAYAGGFESVQEYRYLTGTDDNLFGSSLETLINADNIFSREDAIFSLNSFYANDIFQYEPIYTYATDSVFGSGAGSGGSSSGGFYDSLPLFSEDISGDFDEEDDG